MTNIDDIINSKINKYAGAMEALAKGDEMTCIHWNTRPVEDALNARIAELEAENERLSQLLHDEMSQLEIATDLGNKRWTALNKIYEHGEKHNTNWCKRIAQEGLGIK